MEENLQAAIREGNTDTILQLLAREPYQHTQITSKKETEETPCLQKQRNQEEWPTSAKQTPVEAAVKDLCHKFPMLDVSDIQPLYEACAEDKDLTQTVLESLASSQTLSSQNADASMEIDMEEYYKALQNWSNNFPSLGSNPNTSQMVNDFKRISDNSQQLLFNLRLQKLIALFPTMDETKIASCLQKNQCKYDRSFSELVQVPNDGIDSLSKMTSYHPTKLGEEKPTTETYLHKHFTSKVWVSTGENVSQLYEKYRQQAREMASLRNQMFTQAARAASVGNKKAASEYAKRGHQYNQLMKQIHEEAAETIFTTRNQSDAVIDLHGLHRNEALHILEEKLRELAKKPRSSSQDIIIVTGSGHHTKGKRNHARLYPVVEQFLKEHHYHYQILKDTNQYAGAFLLHVG